MGKFVDWIKSFFKKKPEPIVKTEQELLNDKHRSKYRVELFNNLYYVQYYFNGEWWYLRKWDEDYVFEESRGMGIRISELKLMEQIITSHQQWLSGGHFFLPFK